MSTGNFSPAYIEDFHSLLMKKFHELRPTKATGNGGNIVVLNGSDLNDLIASAKMEFYQARPDAKDAGFEQEQV